MKIIYILASATLVFLSTKSLYAQASTTKIANHKQVSFVTVFHVSNASKDGYYVNGYVVNIDPEKAKQIDGRKIKLTGRVSIVKGLEKNPDEDGVKRQGRSTDTKYIDKPKIKLLD